MEYLFQQIYLICLFNGITNFVNIKHVPLLNLSMTDNILWHTESFALRLSAIHSKLSYKEAIKSNIDPKRIFEVNLVTECSTAKINYCKSRMINMVEHSNFNHVLRSDYLDKPHPHISSYFHSRDNTDKTELNLYRNIHVIRIYSACIICTILRIQVIILQLTLAALLHNTIMSRNFSEICKILLVFPVHTPLPLQTKARKSISGFVSNSRCSFNVNWIFGTQNLVKWSAVRHPITPRSDSALYNLSSTDGSESHAKTFTSSYLTMILLIRSIYLLRFSTLYTLLEIDHCIVVLQQRIKIVAKQTALILSYTFSISILYFYKLFTACNCLHRQHSCVVNTNTVSLTGMKFSISSRDDCDFFLFRSQTVLFVTNSYFVHDITGKYLLLIDDNRFVWQSRLQFTHLYQIVHTNNTTLTYNTTGWGIFCVMCPIRQYFVNLDHFYFNRNHSRKLCISNILICGKTFLYLFYFCVCLDGD